MNLLAHAVAQRPVHELVTLDSPLPAGHLREPLIHLNYERVSEFIAKQKYYAGYDAERLRLEGVRARPHHFVLQCIRDTSGESTA